MPPISGPNCSSFEHTACADLFNQLGYEHAGDSFFDGIPPDLNREIARLLPSQQIIDFSNQSSLVRRDLEPLTAPIYEERAIATYNIMCNQMKILGTAFCTWGLAAAEAVNVTIQVPILYKIKDLTNTIIPEEAGTIVRLWAGIIAWIALSYLTSKIVATYDRIITRFGVKDFRFMDITARNQGGCVGGLSGVISLLCLQDAPSIHRACLSSAIIAGIVVINQFYKLSLPHHPTLPYIPNISQVCDLRGFLGSAVIGGLIAGGASGAIVGGLSTGGLLAAQKVVNTQKVINLLRGLRITRQADEEGFTLLLGIEISVIGAVALGKAGYL